MAKRKIAVIDCETDPFEHGAEIAPFIWGLIEEDYTKHVFKTAAELIEFLKDKNWIVYAHNGGKFDYHFLLEFIEDFSPVMIISGRLAKFKIGDCEFRDSYNLFPLPLAAYKKDEFDYNKMKKENRGRYMEEITRYMLADCEYLLELVMEFINQFGMNLTLAGAAMKQWTQIDGKPYQSDDDYFQTFNEFYYGGRVEAFKTGVFNKKLFLFDINSAYPYAMLDKHPYGGVWDFLDNDGSPIPIENQNFYTIIAPSRGFFPFKDKEKLSFPNDGLRRLFNVTGWELALYDKHYKDYEILSYKKCLSFKRFDEYILKWYEQKNNSEKGTPDYIFAKLMMNSLYGKFGANPDKYKEYEIIPSNCILAHEYETGAEFAGMIGDRAIMAADLNENKKRFYDVATAASITGFVRAFLFDKILTIKANGGTVYYCDTDSIVFTHKKPRTLFNVTDKLGDWDCEGEFDAGAFAGKKLYALKYANTSKYKTASKGVKLSAAEIFSVAQGNEITYKSESPTFSVKRGRFYQSRKVKKTA